MKLLFLFFFLFMIFTVKSQKTELEVCKGDTLYTAYEPNLVFQRYSIYNFEDTFTYHIDSQILEIREKRFRHVPTSSNNGRSFFWLYESSDGTLYYCDTTHSNMVNTFIPKDEIEGYEVRKLYHLDYKIAGYHVHISTPICDYKDAIMVLSKHSELEDYTHGVTFYYVRKLGFVAQEYRGILESYMTNRFFKK